MKTLITILALTITTIVTANNPKRIEVEDFNYLNISNAVHVTIEEGNKNYVLVNGTDDQMEEFQCESFGSTLIIKRENPNNDFNENKYEGTVHVTIFKNDLKQINATIACIVESKGTITTDYLQINADLASNIDIKAKAKTIVCKANSASDININAECDNLKAYANAASNISIKATTKDLICEANTASKIDIDVQSTNVSVEANNVSKITAKGKCEKIEVLANNASKCELSYLIGVHAISEANNMSEVFISTSKSIESEASNMSKTHYFQPSSYTKEFNSPKQVGVSQTQASGDFSKGKP